MRIGKKKLQTYLSDLEFAYRDALLTSGDFRLMLLSELRALFNIGVQFGIVDKGRYEALWEDYITNMLRSMPFFEKNKMVDEAKFRKQFKERLIGLLKPRARKILNLEVYGGTQSSD